MHSTDTPRPATLYRYSRRHWLQRSLTLGEFRLRPADDFQAGPGRGALVISRAGTAAGYLTLSLTQAGGDRLFEAFPRADCCLVIHDSEQFGERLHRAVQKALPTWAGIDAAVAYGQPSKLGAAFCRDERYALQQEWRFAWRPTMPARMVSSLVVRIGSIEDFAELREKNLAARAG